MQLYIVNYRDSGEHTPMVDIFTHLDDAQAKYDSVISQYSNYGGPLPLPEANQIASPNFKIFMHGAFVNLEGQRVHEDP